MANIVTEELQLDHAMAKVIKLLTCSIRAFIHDVQCFKIFAGQIEDSKTIPMNVKLF